MKPKTQIIKEWAERNNVPFLDINLAKDGMPPSTVGNVIFTIELPLESVAKRLDRVYDALDALLDEGVISDFNMSYCDPNIGDKL